MAKLLFQGHNSHRLTTADGAVIYIDPFFGKGYDKPADLILSTHEHYDHNKFELCAKKENCRILRSGEAQQPVGTYNNFDLCGMHIQAVQAYNKNHKKEECVGYLIDVDGLRLYFLGDTNETEQMHGMDQLGIDYAFIPIDGVYNMTPAQGIEVSKLIGARHSVPVHSLRDDQLTAETTYSKEHCEEFLQGAVNALFIQPGVEVEL